MAAFHHRRGHNRVPHGRQTCDQGGSKEGSERSLLGRRRRLRRAVELETSGAATGGNGAADDVSAAKRPREAPSNPYLRAMTKHTRPQCEVPSINGPLPGGESSSGIPDPGTSYSGARPTESSLSASVSESSSSTFSHKKKKKKKKRKEELMPLERALSQKAEILPRRSHSPLLSAADHSPSPLPGCSTETKPTPRLVEEVQVTPFSSSPRRTQKSATSSTKSCHPPEKQVVALDCEMVGCLPDDSGLEELSGSTPVSLSERLHLLATRKLGRKKRGLKEISVAGRCTIVDYNGGVLYDSFIRPNRRILSLRTFVSGITQRDMANATPIDDARREILDILQGRLVVAHDIKHDLASLGISLPSTSIWDTSSCKALRRLAGLPESQVPSLRNLADGVLGVQIHTGCHSSLEDARVAMQLYRAVEEDLL